MGTTLKHALHLLGRDQWWRWVALVVLALFVSGLEVLGAALVYLLLALVADPEGAIDLPLIGDIRELLPAAGEQDLLLLAIATMGAFFVLRAAIRILAKYLQQRVAHNAGAHLSNRLVEGYLRSPYEWHLHRSSAELIRNANQAVKSLVSQVFVPAIRIMAESVLVAGMLILLVVISPLATALAVLVVGLASAVLLLVVQPRLKRLGRQAHDLSRETLNVLQQSLHGYRDIRLLGRERAFARDYGRRRIRFARASYLSSTLKELPTTIIELALLTFILLFFALTIIFGDGTQQALSLIGLFAYAGLRMQPSLQKIIAGFNELKFSSAPLEDLSADLRAIEGLPAEDEIVAPAAFTDRVCLESVTFTYHGADGPALRDVDLCVRKGEQIGICGPTGGGKSTLVDVLAGLLEPQAGQVTLDGRELGERRRAWQRSLGVVSQMVFLTDDTLRRNIALGVPADRIDEAAVSRAVRLAQLEEFVAALPQGLDTHVGERGTRVSGGQRQRIAIARALYSDPKVLIFDEGTSALDNRTEATLMEAIESLRGRHTIILVAHRLSTVKSCDRVVFVAGGRIEGVGSFEQLVQDNASFRALAASL